MLWDGGTLRVPCPNNGTERKLDLTGASEMNRLYPNSRRESIKEDKYLNTLPRRGGGWRKKRPNENETKVRHEGRNGGAQGRGGLTAPKTRSRSTKNAVGMKKSYTVI
ncbi:hypothetical protein TNCV_540201 [Trichonephila clavipes]|nr:hypothetical protein TNCV_540201 [Trichonephila clavipes]